MDCVDCHNRPTHAFELPHRGLDREITAGAISRDLPFVKKRALELLKGKYPSQDAATKAIADGLASYYTSQYPDVAKAKKTEIEAAVKAVQAVYLRNVFPDMKLDWGYHRTTSATRISRAASAATAGTTSRRTGGRSRPTARPVTRCSPWMRRTRRSWRSSA